MSEQNGDAKLIDKFKEKYQLKDIELAFVLDVPRSQITNWKTGHRPMPWPMRARIAEHVDLIGVRDFVLLFLDKEDHERLMQEDKKRLLLSVEERRFVEGVNYVELINSIKQRLNLDDDKLADWLDLTPQVLHEIKLGEKISISNKLSIINAIIGKGGYVWGRDAVLSVFPDKIKTAIINFDNARINKMIEKIASKKFE